jgi:hypothetical protein
MSYATITWEASTAGAGRAARQALAPFGPARLLENSWLVDTERQNVEDIRRALDTVAAGFPTEFFYTTSKHVEADIQGLYPASAQIAAACVITGSARNPRVRGSHGAGLAADEELPALAAPPPSRRPRKRAAGRKASRRKTTRQRGRR